MCLQFHESQSWLNMMYWGGPEHSHLQWFEGTVEYLPAGANLNVNLQVTAQEEDSSYFRIRQEMVRFQLLLWAQTTVVIQARKAPWRSLHWVGTFIYQKELDCSLAHRNQEWIFWGWNCGLGGVYVSIYPTPNPPHPSPPTSCSLNQVLSLGTWSPSSMLSLGR